MATLTAGPTGGTVVVIVEIRVRKLHSTIQDADDLASTGVASSPCAFHVRIGNHIEIIAQVPLIAKTWI